MTVIPVGAGTNESSARPTAPALVAPLTNFTAHFCSNFTLSVQATGAPPLTYQWWREREPLPGAINAGLAFANLGIADRAAYSVVVSNAYGTLVTEVPMLPIAPSVVQHPQSVTAQTGSTVTFSASAIGLPPMNYQWFRYPTEMLSGQTRSWLTLSNVSSADAGRYFLRVSSVGNGSVDTQPATLTVTSLAVTDRLAPVVTVTRPRVLLTRQFSNVVTLAGVARDNLGVAAVFARAGAAEAEILSGTTHWSGDFSLDPGTNVFRLIARDVSGHDSMPVTRVVVYAVSNTLSLAIGGEGGVAGVTNGQALELGRDYRLRAGPRTGHLFSNWVGSVTSTSPVLVFRMVSNATLRANFVPSPFLGLKGAYYGLFQHADTALAGHDTSGAIQLLVSDGGAFTGKLSQGRTDYSLSGRFGLDLTARIRVPRPGTNDLWVTLSLEAGVDRFTGVVSNATWSGEVNGYRAMFKVPTHPAARFVGRFDVTLSATTNSSMPLPSPGVGTITVMPSGNATVRLTLADGTPVSRTTPLSARGEIPIYAGLYRGLGFLFGWTRVLGTSTNDISGRLLWTKRGGVHAGVPFSGFTNELVVTGSR